MLTHTELELATNPLDNDFGSKKRIRDGGLECSRIPDFQYCLHGGGQIGAIAGEHRRVGANLRPARCCIAVGTKVVVEPPFPHPFAQDEQFRSRARIGRPSRSAVALSATIIADAPSVICDELPAVMSGAVSGSHDWAGDRPDRDSIEPFRRMPSSDSKNPPDTVPSSPFSGTGRASAAKRPSSQEAAARR